MRSMSIGKAWDEARAILVRDGKLMLSVTLALVMIPMALLGLVDPQALEQIQAEDYEPTAISSLLSLVMAVLGIVAQIAIVAMALKTAASVGEAIRQGFSNLLAVIGVILLLILAAVALILPVVVATIGIERFAALADYDPTSVTVPAEALPGAFLLAFFVLILAFIYVGVRLSLLVPSRVAEGIGPIAMIKRSWALTKGHFWRILGFYLLFGIAVIVFALVYGMMFGLIGQLLFGDVEPMSVGALYTGLIAGLLQALLTVVSSTIVARIYAQLVAEPVASVPPTA